MSRKMTYAAAALVATLAVGLGTNEATAQDLGGFLRIADDGFSIGIDIRDDDFVARRFHSHPRYRIVRDRVWREGYWKTVEQPAVYRTIDRRNGPDLRVLVRPARCERIFVPGYWDLVERRILVGHDRCYQDHGRIGRHDVRRVYRHDDRRGYRSNDRRDYRRDDRGDDHRRDDRRDGRRDGRLS